MGIKVFGSESNDKRCLERGRKGFAVSVTLTPTVYEKLKKFVEQNDLNLSHACRILIERGL